MLDKKVIEYKDFGLVNFKLDKIMEKRDISVYELSLSANVPFNTIKKLKQGINITRINTDVIAKLCYVLDCEIHDIMEYEKPTKK